MKKLVLLFALLLPVTVWAAKYPSMVFTTTQGDEFSISSANLTINVEGDKIVATSGEDVLTFDALELASMEFSTETTTVVDNLVSENSALALYTLDGRYVGEFCCLEKAKNALDGGIYVAVMKNGGTVKINIKK